MARVQSRQMHKPYSVLTLLVLIATSFGQTKNVSSQDVFRSDDSSFQFRYPKSLVLCYPEDHSKSESDKSSSCSLYIPICDAGVTTTDSAALHPETIVCVAYPHSPYAGTNFGGAAFSVSSVPDATAEKDCLKFDEFTMDKKKAHWTTIGNEKFRAASGGEGGLGHGLGEDVYLRYHNGKCYQLEIRIGETSFANYDPGTIKEFKDYDKVSRELRRVLQSFRFLK
jgi:hypothetical protein